MRTDHQRRQRGGLNRAAQMAHVIEGKLHTTSQVAAALGISHCAAYERIKNRPHPLTWDALRKMRIRRKG